MTDSGHAPGPEELLRWWAAIREALTAVHTQVLRAFRAVWSWYCRMRQVLARAEWRWAHRTQRFFTRHPDLVVLDRWLDHMYPTTP